MEGSRVPDATIQKDQNIIHEKEMVKVTEITHFQSFEFAFPFCGFDEPTKPLH